LANDISKCLSCGSTSSEPAEGSEPGEPDIISDSICIRCHEAMVERYSRSFHIPGLPTLGDFLLEAYARRYQARVEAIDFDIREVLPRLSDEAKPAQRRSRGDDPQLRDALSRVGKTVCLTTPEGFLNSSFPGNRHLRRDVAQHLCPLEARERLPRL
jgi:hypothetical protein